MPTYPRHPLDLAQQALSLYDIAHGRLRLGIGPSHQAIIEGIYGLSQTTPLAHLREYVKVLRAALWEGKVDHHGQFFNVVVTLPRTTQTPVLISTLGKKAFQLAGESLMEPFHGCVRFRICSIREFRHYAQQQRLPMDDQQLLHHWWHIFR